MGRDYGQIQSIAITGLRPLFRFCWRFHVDGLDRVPIHGPTILTPNHISVIDSFFLPTVLPRGITFVGKAEYLDDWKTRWLFPALGMIPIDRSGGDAAQAALDAARKVLRSGELFGIYPEGTRARDGLLHKGKTGAARLALETGAPIVPVGIIGTREIQPPDTPFPKLFRAVRVRFGEPIPPSRYPDGLTDHRQLRAYTDEVMFAIRDLTGQEYVHEYATKPLAAAEPEVDLPEPASSISVLRPRPLSDVA